LTGRKKESLDRMAQAFFFFGFMAAG